jgi:light-regulated signal transduction histidine kinase (bacteriophytochrome)
MLVSWAGEPGDQVVKDLSPRRSFGLWKETVKGQGRTWSKEDVEMAEISRRGLVARFGEESVHEDSFERAMHQLREYVLYLEENTQAMQRINDDLRAPLHTVRSSLPLIRNETAQDPEHDSLFFSPPQAILMTSARPMPGGPTPIWSSPLT